MCACKFDSQVNVIVFKKEKQNKTENANNFNLTYFKIMDYKVFHHCNRFYNKLLVHSLMNV